MGDKLQAWLEKNAAMILKWVIAAVAIWAIPYCMTTVMTLTSEKRVKELITNELTPIKSEVKVNKDNIIINNTNIAVLQSTVNTTMGNINKTLTDIQTDIAFLKGKEEGRKKK